MLKKLLYFISGLDRIYKLQSPKEAQPPVGYAFGTALA